MARRRIALSQNFLHDPAAVRRLVRAAGLGPDDLVLEPGAGEGVVTRALAGQRRRVVAYELDPRRRVVAYELDPRLAARLPRRTGPGTRVVEGDFLRARPPGEAFAVVGNIPYSRTSDIVRWCLDAPHLTSATLLTQREYARKRTGDHGRWSRLTVRTWPEHAWRLGPRVPRHAFTPVPRTDSAVLHLERRPVPLLPPELLPHWREFVDDGFTGTGGSLGATLSRTHGSRRTRAAFCAARTDTTAPVGLVPPEVWLTLFRMLR